MEKDILTIKENAFSYGRGYVYSLQYHLVWCTKYRKQILKNGIDAECKRMLYELAQLHHDYLAGGLLEYMAAIFRKMTDSDEMPCS